MTDRVFNRTFDAIAKSLDMQSQKTKIISANIANADTPGYQAKRIDFEDALSSALSLEDAPAMRTHRNHIAAGGEINHINPEIYNDPNNIVREDGNTVDRDAEMIALTENQIRYNATMEALNRKIALLRYAITEGGR